MRRRLAHALFCTLTLATPLARAADPDVGRAFTPRDLVDLSRLTEPRLSPDGQTVVYTQSDLDWDNNKRTRSIWRVGSTPGGAPVRLSQPGANAWAPAWSATGQQLYFLSDRSGSVQLWRMSVNQADAQPVTHLPLDIDSYRLAPDGVRVAVALSVFADCPTLACTTQRLDARGHHKASGMHFDSLFVRHWDTWSDGRRAQLFVTRLDAPDGTEPAHIVAPVLGDVPSAPFGDAAEYDFSPDSRQIYFDLRAGGHDEAWSTNFDIYAAAADGSGSATNLTADNPAWDGFPLAAPDGKHLYYLAMRRPGFEADRFGIVELTLTTGTRRDVAPDWDRSAGPLQISADGKTLYTSADDHGQHPLFAVDIASGKVRQLTHLGHVADFSVANQTVVVARDTLISPTDLYRLEAGDQSTALTAVNADRLRQIRFSPYEDFHFQGWNNETVRGTVVKPYGFVAGKKYPVAFLIHGGPQGSWLDNFHYRWNAQTFAGAGFAVVTIDFHGSTGYGQAFTDAISHHWGDRPLQDLQKGWAAALQRFPYLAGDRACALGASYGGYMINWIAGNWSTPDSGAWRCLVNHDGDFDTHMAYYATEELWFAEWEAGGTPWDVPEAHQAFNPSAHVGNWKTPMLVIHGAKDYRVTLDNGLATFTALQRRGIPSELLVFPDENHWVLKPQNSVQWNNSIQDWLKRWTR
jgi:dipeptidyl aminopeptidase/acylaminoacyl peptidase